MNTQKQPAEAVQRPIDENTGILVEDMIKIKDLATDEVLYWGRG